MHPISKKLFYDKAFFAGKLPENSRYLPNPAHEYPIYIKEDLLSAEACDALVHNALNNGYKKPATVGVDNNIVKKVRHTDYLLPDEKYREIYMNAVTSVKQDIANYFNLSFEETGETQTLGYPIGGHYMLHADDSERQYNKQGELTHWKATNNNRSLSTLLYLTDSVDEITGDNQCIGGNIEFRYLKDKNGEPFLLQPKKGTYVVFPSNPYFSHCVHEVYEGYRVAIVNWYKKV